MLPVLYENKNFPIALKSLSYLVSGYIAGFVGIVLYFNSEILKGFVRLKYDLGFGD
jgi:hypothetical protein